MIAINERKANQRGKYFDINLNRFIKIKNRILFGWGYKNYYHFRAILLGPGL